MTVLVDTSALYALMDADDINHERASAFWSGFSGEESLVTHNYVLLETCALTQRRLGIDAVRRLVDDLLQPVSTVFVEAELHRMAIAAVLAARVADVSLVDTVSLEIMRRLRIRRAFAFDAHFDRFGFESVPR